MTANEIAGRRAQTLTDSIKRALASKSSNQSVKELTEAESLLSAQGPFKYLVNYRVEKDDTSPKGSRSVRYDHLIALIKALTGKEWHLSTSAWLVTSRHRKGGLLKLLSRPLDETMDFLSVTPVADPATFGKARLES